MGESRLSFWARFKLALAFVFGSGKLPEAPPPPPPAQLPALSPEAAHASALFLLGMLQREGRLIDFLQEDVTGFTDDQVGAAARVVHTGCRKVLREYLPLQAVVPQSEGDAVTVPVGFDANRFRLSGAVTGPGPHNGSLKHHGWLATEVKLPAVPTALNLKVLAPAEVELP
jgi:hypothetical protein